MVKALLGRLVALAIILTAVGVGWSYYRATQHNPTSDDASIDADVVHMAASVGGRIVELPVQENQLVRKDEVVFRIDPEPYRLRLEAALAEVKAGEGLLASQTRAVATERANVEIADQQVVRARSNLELATNTLARIKPLHPKGYVSDQQVDDAATAKRNAETSLTQAMQQAAEVRHRVGLAPDDVVQDPVTEILQRAADPENIVVGADHPQCGVRLHHAARGFEPSTGKVVVGGKTGELVPVVVHGIDHALIGTGQARLAELEVVGRVGEDAVDARSRQPLHGGDAISDQDFVEGKCVGKTLDGGCETHPRRRRGPPGTRDKIPGGGADDRGTRGSHGKHRLRD